MLRKVGLALGWLGYTQVVPSDSIPTYEIGPIVVAEHYGVAPVYRLEPSRQLGASTLQATFERVPGFSGWGHRRMAGDLSCGVCPISVFCCCIIISPGRRLLGRRPWLRSSEPLLLSTA